MKWEHQKQQWLRRIQNVRPLDQPMVIVSVIVTAYFLTGFVDWVSKL